MRNKCGMGEEWKSTRREDGRSRPCEKELEREVAGGRPDSTNSEPSGRISGSPISTLNGSDERHFVGG